MKKKKVTKFDAKMRAQAKLNARINGSKMKVVQLQEVDDEDQKPVTVTKEKPKKEAFEGPLTSTTYMKEVLSQVKSWEDGVNGLDRKPDVPEEAYGKGEEIKNQDLYLDIAKKMLGEQEGNKKCAYQDVAT